MHMLSWSKGFRRGFKRATRKNPNLQNKIFTALEKLSIDPFSSDLKTHKLHGKLAGLWACEVEYDCRVVFSFGKCSELGEKIIVLADIGKHDEVY